MGRVPLALHSSAPISHPGQGQVSIQCRMKMSTTNRALQLFVMRAKLSESATVHITRRVYALLATMKSRLEMDADRR